MNIIKEFKKNTNPKPQMELNMTEDAPKVICENGSVVERIEDTEMFQKANPKQKKTKSVTIMDPIDGTYKIVQIIVNNLEV
jgi:3'-phosphoadenosine 5'-phosphosulfate (PAPS) 3'-phosphatase